jgi:hypothetical protein
VANTVYEYQDPAVPPVGTTLLVTNAHARGGEGPGVLVTMYDNADLIDVWLDRGQVISLRARLSRWLNEEARRGTP